MLSQDDYKLLSPIPAPQVNLKLLGIFEKKPIIWDLTLYTLSEYYTNVDSAVPVDERRQFIFVSKSNNVNEREIKIGLNIQTVDRQAIIKTIKMVRNYKLLHEGWHKWGPVITIRGD